MMEPKVAIIVPTFNSLADCLTCLESLSRITYPNLEITVVDDGSTDGTAEAVRKQFPKVRVLQGDGNLWWTGCMNLGLRDALERGADYGMAMNSDVRVAPDCVSELVGCAQANQPCIVGSVIYDAGDPQRIWCAGGILRWPFRGTVMLGHGELDCGQFEGVREVEWTPGMGTLYPRKILLELGCYDRRFPQYHADADLTLRARRKGFRVLVTSGSRLYNNVASTGGLRQEGITWPEIRGVFISLKSADNVKTLPSFIWRHSPWYLAPVSIGWRYFSVTASIARRLGRQLLRAKRSAAVSDPGH